MENNINGLQNITFSVTSDELKIKAEAVREHIRQLIQIWEEELSISDGTRIYWNSQSADVYRSSVHDLAERLEQIFKNWESVAVKLEQIAGVYEESEKKAEMLQDELPTDLLK